MKPSIGVQGVVELLSGLDPEHRKRLLDELAKKDPTLAAEVERRIFTFEDLVKASPKSLQLILKEAGESRLVFALRGVAEDVKEVIFQNMSKKRAEILQEEITNLGPQKRSEVQKAQTEIIEIAKKLAAEGKVELPK